MIKTLCFSWITDIHSFFSIRIYFIRRARLKFAKFQEYFKNKPRRGWDFEKDGYFEWWKSKKYVFNLTVSSYCFLPRQSYPTKRRNMHWLYSQMFIHEIHIYSIQPKKNNNKINEQTAKKDMINSFFFNSNSREYFQAKIGRKIRIFSLARKNNILMWKKSV